MVIGYKKIPLMFNISHCLFTELACHGKLTLQHPLGAQNSELRTESEKASLVVPTAMGKCMVTLDSPLHLIIALDSRVSRLHWDESNVKIPICGHMTRQIFGVSYICDGRHGGKGAIWSGRSLRIIKQ
jgi:hypothetical protein